MMMCIGIRQICNLMSEVLIKLQFVPQKQQNKINNNMKHLWESSVKQGGRHVLVMH